MTEIMSTWIMSILYSLDNEIVHLILNIKLDYFTHSLTAVTWNSFINNIFNIVEPISLIIVSICFLVEFLKITIKFEVLKWEFLFKIFFKLVFAKICIDVSFDFLMAIYQTAIEWCGKIGAGTPLIGMTIWGDIKDTIQDYSTLEMIGLVCSSGILYIGISICTLIARIMVFVRMIEIVIYISLSPLPCALLPLEDGGTSRIPKNYFINFASLCLSGVIMMMSVYLYGVLVNEIFLADAGMSVLQKICTVFVAVVILVLTMSKSGNIAKSILSAG